MLRSYKASFPSESRPLTVSSYFVQTLRKAMPVLAVATMLFATRSSSAQTPANAANFAQINKSCDGQMPQKSSVQGHSSGAAASSGSLDAAKDHLQLSTKATSSDSTDPQGQFCKRERPDHASELTPVTPQAAESPAQSSQPDAPPPIAEITGGELTVRANGQDFAAVLDAVRSVTGITVEMPPESVTEPVFMNVGPVSTKSALMALLDGTKYNYVMVGSDKDPQLVTRLILSERSSQGAPSFVASTASGSAPLQPELYGGQGFNQDTEAQNTEPPPPTPPPAVIPPSVPTGVNIQQMAAQANKTPGQILDELQKRQLQMLDDQAAQPQPQQ